MSRRAVTRQMYDDLVAAYRLAPGNHFHAAKLAGVFWRTAKKAWEVGWSPRLPFATPIKDVIASEQAEANSQLAQVRERELKLLERERAITQHTNRSEEQRDAIARHREWAKACSATRHNCLASIATIGEMLKAALSRADAIKASMSKLNLPPDKLVHIIKELTTAHRQACEALNITQQVEHLEQGRPTEILGVSHRLDITVEDAIERIDAAHIALQRARQRGDLILPLPTPAPQGDTIDAEVTEVIDATGNRNDA